MDLIIGSRQTVSKQWFGESLRLAARVALDSVSQHEQTNAHYQETEHRPGRNTLVQLSKHGQRQNEQSCHLQESRKAMHDSRLPGHGSLGKVRVGLTDSGLHLVP